jgi:hypothetical protein
MARVPAIRWWHLGLAIALLAGAVFRLIWVEDMEYKSDEIYMFERTRNVGVTEPWPWLGMVSNAQLHNPGMSVWVFLLPGKLLGGTEDPTVLARVTQVLSLAALGLMVVFALRWIPDEEREIWLWAVVIAAVNPPDVCLQRKIWAQSVLPFFSMLFLLAWWKRQHRGGAFAWGLVGACLGQIHMSGFFYAAGFALWTLVFDRRSVRWGSWLAGSFWGTLPLLPWIYYVLHAPSSELPSGRSWTNLLVPSFWLYWSTDPLGTGIWWPLLRQFREFLGYPILAGTPTYLVGVLYVLALGIGVLIYARAGYLVASGRWPWRELVMGKGPSTALAMGAALGGFGLLLTATGVPIGGHYLLVAFPLLYVWLARLALPRSAPRWPGRVLLATLCVAQFLVAADFLAYIHINQGAVDGYYGKAYGAQLERPDSSW